MKSKKTNVDAIRDRIGQIGEWRQPKLGDFFRRLHESHVAYAKSVREQKDWVL